MFSPLPPAVESGHVNLGAFSKTFADYRLVANDAAGFVRKGDHIRPNGIVKGRRLKRHDHAVEVILSAHGASDLVSAVRMGLYPAPCRGEPEANGQCPELGAAPEGSLHFRLAHRSTAGIRDPLFSTRHE